MALSASGESGMRNPVEHPLRAIRLKLNWKQTALAARLGISVARFGQYELGHRLATSSFVAKWAQALGEGA